MQKEISDQKVTSDKKIHFVHFTKKPGGIEVLLPGIIKALKMFTFSVFAIRPLKAGDDNVYSDVDVQITTGAKGLKAYISLYKYARKYKKDVFQVFNIGPIFLFVLRIAGIKNLIYSIHGTVYWKSTFQKFIRKIFWKLSMLKHYIITANSEYSASVFREKVLNKNILVLYNPIDTNRFSITNKIISPLEKTKIIYSGRLAKGKNLELWIKIANYLLKKDDNYCFEIYGTGPLKDQLQAQIDTLGIGEHIKLKGYTNHPEEIYKNTDLLLFLSEYESFGNVVVESILCGTPVICSNIPSMHEIFNNQTEFLVNLDKNIFENIYLKLNILNELQLAAQILSKKFSAKYGHHTHYRILEEIYNKF